MKENIRITKETQFAVLGLSQFGRSVTRTLFENGHDVICCDIDEHMVAEAAEYSTMAVELDVTEEAALTKVGIQNVDIAIIALSSSLEASALVALTLKEFGIKYMVAETSERRQKNILESIGVDRVVLPKREIGEKVAYELITNNLVDFIHSADDYNIFEMAPKDEWVNKSLRDLELRRNEGMNVIAVIRNGKINAVLDPDTKILNNDSLVVLKLDIE